MGETNNLLCTSADVYNLLQMEESESNATSIQRAIKEASASIRNYTNQYISFLENDVTSIDGNGGDKICLPELPVKQIVSVVVDGRLLVADKDYKLGKHGILHRINGKWYRGIQNIVITYSHGYETIPDDITAVCTRMASRIFQAGLSASETNGNPNIASVSLGDYSTSYTGTSTASDGILGVSGARLILYSEKEMLNKYRIESF